MPNLASLRLLFAKPNLRRFRREFDSALANSHPAAKEDLRRLAAEAFQAVLEAMSLDDGQTLKWFGQHYDNGNIAETPGLRLALQRLMRASARDAELKRFARLELKTPVLQMQRVVQTSWFGTAGFEASDAFEIRRSVYRSPQEREFGKAIRLRFPNLDVYPNYPIDQIIDLRKLAGSVASRALHYARDCRIDCGLFVPVEGDCIAAFELDSKYHDTEEAILRDRWKETVLSAAGVPLFRLRTENPETATQEEWYSALTEQVVDKVDCGQRIRVRDVHAVLVPIVR